MQTRSHSLPSLSNWQFAKHLPPVQSQLSNRNQARRACQVFSACRSDVHKAYNKSNIQYPSEFADWCLFTTFPKPKAKILGMETVVNFVFTCSNVSCSLTNQSNGIGMHSSNLELFSKAKGISSANYCQTRHYLSSNSFSLVKLKHTVNDKTNIKV